MTIAPSPETPARARLPGVWLSVLYLLAACTAEPLLVPVECGTLPVADTVAVPPASVDTLYVILRLDRAPTGSVLVRVDALDDEGIVTFQGPVPPTAAAVGVALTLSATFQGCFDPAPNGFLLQAAEAPRSKAWIRVSSDRPVRIRVEIARADSRTPVAVERLVVLPGSSGRADWDLEVPR